MLKTSLQINKLSLEIKDNLVFDKLSLALSSSSINFIINDKEKASLLFQTLLNLNDYKINATFYNNKINNCFEEIAYYKSSTDIYKDYSIKEFFDYSQAFYKNNYKKERYDLLNLFGFDDKTIISTLPKEKLELLKIIEQIYHNPSLIILDYPYEYLNEEDITKLNDYLLYLKENGSTILISSDNINYLYNKDNKYYIFFESKLNEMLKLKNKRFELTIPVVNIDNMNIKFNDVKYLEERIILTYEGPFVMLFNELRKLNTTIYDLKVGDIV